jgi:hypothetical protein
MEYLSSMYIDNEMDLTDKRRFIEKIRSDRKFFTLTLELLAQEQRLRQQPVLIEKSVEKKWRPPFRFVLDRIFKPLGFAAAGSAAAVLILFTAINRPAITEFNHRFVLFEPAANQVELAGSLTGWQRIRMQRIGDSGYWELNLRTTVGEHRFTYILDGRRRISDPTLPVSEMDDFGGYNSILRVEGRI